MTHENHFQFGLKNPRTGDVRYGANRLSSDEIFVARYGRARDELSSWRDANREAARLILQRAERSDLVPTLLMSGGLDSEIMLVAFLEALNGNPSSQIRLASARYADGVNAHDLSYLDRFLKTHPLAKSHNLEHIVVDIDPLKFWGSEDFYTRADHVQVVSPQILCHLLLCDKLYDRDRRTMPVIGQGEIHLIKDVPPNYEPGVSPYHPSTWKLVESERLCGLYRHFLLHGRTAVPGFFQYLPEQFETQLRLNPVYHALLSHSLPGKLGTRTSKPEILAHDYPELEKRPKFHGFEPIQALHDQYRTELAKRLPDHNANWYQPVFEFYESIRPFKSADPSLSHAPWDFAFKGASREASLSRRRHSVHDIFATRTRVPDMVLEILKQPDPISADPFFDIHREFFKTEINTRPLVLLDDGSLLAQLLKHCGPETLHSVAIEDLDRVSALETLPLVMVRRLFDVDLVVLFKLAERAIAQNPGASVLVPILPMRFYHRTPGQRLVEAESERYAALIATFEEVWPNTKFIWLHTSEAILRAHLRAVQSTGFFDKPQLEEAHGFHHSLIAEWLKIPQMETDSKMQQALLQKLSEVRASLSQCAPMDLRYQQSSTPVESFQRGPYPSLELLSSALHSAGLITVSVEEWAERARAESPDLRLGSNLYAYSKVCGFDLFDDGLRLGVALPVSGSSVNAVLLLHRISRETLRIRGVTVTSDLRRKGFATELLTRLMRAMTLAPSGIFRSIEVFAAPEAVNPFLSAGFVPDPIRPALSDEVFDSELRRFRSSDRLLTPLKWTPPTMKS